MSEYQYFEFQAVDRPLTQAEMRQLRAVSTRATITATRFVNSYTWGDFKGNGDPQSEVSSCSHRGSKLSGQEEVMGGTITLGSDLAAVLKRRPAPMRPSGSRGSSRSHSRRRRG